MGGVEPPRCQHAVLVLIDHEGGEVIVLAAVFEAILVVREGVDEVVPAVIAPRHCPLACAARVIVGVFAAAAVAPFQVAAGIDHQARGALAITNGLRRHADHFADRGQLRGRELDVA